MKKLLTIILAVLISFASLPVYAFAKDVLDITENRIAEQETVEATDFAEEPVVYAAASSSGGQWVQESNGRWWYKHADGSYIKYDWEYINGSWYFFDKNGWMWTEWLQWEGNWYYLNPSGVMHTGWLKDDGKQYYFTMRGIMVTGWQVINGAYYYFDSSGAMCTGWQVINGAYYYFDSNGAMCTGWIKVNNKWYYMNNDGSMRVGWIKLDGEWYYLNTDGSMQIGWKTINGSWYYFNSSGRMVRETLVQGKRTYNFLSSGELNSTIMAIDRIYQGNTNWCWAAAVAMIANYEYNKNFTMEDVVVDVRGKTENENTGSELNEILIAMQHFLPNRNVQPRYDFKFDTFAWYINKNHPVLVAVTMPVWEEGHVLVCAGYKQDDKSLYFIDSSSFANKKFKEYNESKRRIFLGVINGYANFDYIMIYP